MKVYTTRNVESAQSGDRTAKMRREKLFITRSSFLQEGEKVHIWNLIPDSCLPKPKQSTKTKLSGTKRDQKVEPDILVSTVTGKIENT